VGWKVEKVEWTNVVIEDEEGGASPIIIDGDTYWQISKNYFEKLNSLSIGGALYCLESTVTTSLSIYDTYSKL
jgi:hypothetical protein